MAQPSTYATAQELWLSQLAENLFNDNMFLMSSRDWSSSTNGKTVYWNESGAKPNVKFNSTTGYDAATQRTDVLRSFGLDEVISQPTLVQWTDEYVTNYAKMADIIEDHRMTVGDEAALRILYTWAPTLAANIVRTSGAAKTAAAPAATGTRNRITLADILSARTVLNKDNIPMQGRVMMVPADMEADMMAIDNFISVDYKENKPIQNGMIGTILGMPVFVHSSSITYDNTATPVPNNPKADDTNTAYAGAVTDNQAGFIWHPDYVVRAQSIDSGASLVSMIDVHGGQEISTTMVLGGSPFRSDGKGIVAIVEQP
jgi:hypothetical protein